VRRKLVYWFLMQPFTERGNIEKQSFDRKMRVSLSKDSSTKAFMPEVKKPFSMTLEHVLVFHALDGRSKNKRFDKKKQLYFSSTRCVPIQYFSQTFNLFPPLSFCAKLLTKSCVSIGAFQEERCELFCLCKWMNFVG